MSPLAHARRIGMVTTAAMLLATVVLVAVITVVAVRSIEPGGRFAPLALSGRFYLTNGTDDTPPHIASGAQLQLNAGRWCNNDNATVSTSLSIAIRGANTPPQHTVPIVIGVAKQFAPGCIDDAPIDLTPPDPLAPGEWKMAITVTATESSGRAQVVTIVSEPFVISGVASAATPAARAK